MQSSIISVSIGVDACDQDVHLGVTQRFGGAEEPLTVMDVIGAIIEVLVIIVGCTPHECRGEVVPTMSQL